MKQKINAKINTINDHQEYQLRHGLFMSYHQLDNKDIERSQQQSNGQLFRKLVKKNINIMSEQMIPKEIFRLQEYWNLTFGRHFQMYCDDKVKKVHIGRLYACITTLFYYFVSAKGYHQAQLSEIYKLLEGYHNNIIRNFFLRNNRVQMKLRERIRRLILKDQKDPGYYVFELFKHEWRRRQKPTENR